MVGLALALAGIIGATLVYRAGQSIHERDRRDITTWHAAAAAPIEALRGATADLASFGPRAFDGSLRDERLVRRITLTRAALERSREKLEDTRTPAIVEVIASAYLNGVVATTAALSALHQWSFAGDDSARAREKKRFETELARGARILTEADDALLDLRRRYELA